MPGPRVRRHFEIRNRSRCRINPIRRWLKPACNLRQIKRFQLVGIETHQPNVASLRAPDANEIRGHQKRPTVSVECEARLVGFLLESKRNQVRDRASDRRDESTRNVVRTVIETREKFSSTTARGPTVLERMSRTRDALISDIYPAAGTPGAFTCVRMNWTMSSIAVPGWKIAATPIFFSPSISWFGNNSTDHARSRRPSCSA